MTIKNFSNLVFNDHAHNPNGVQARLDLGNNLEISVVSMKDKETEFGGLYGSVKAGTYEVAVFQSNKMLPLNASDDVRGWQTEDDLNDLMSSLQGNPDDIQDFIDQLYLDKKAMRLELELD
jgi:hypothetical protein|tara:strand:- start:642 stop:1004 length:363 start_codon:yes stop_codon:yes gene_type:complete